MTANTKMTEDNFFKRAELIVETCYPLGKIGQVNHIAKGLKESYQAGRAEGYKISRDHASTIAFSFHEWAVSDCQDHCDSRIAEEIEGMKLNQRDGGKK